jgi:serine/threonine protein kinase
VDSETQKRVAAALFALGPTSPATAQYTSAARINTFTPPLSYMTVRDVLHIQNWIRNETCLAADRVYDTIVCMAGTFKLSAEAVAGHCDATALPCPAGYDCVCAPCEELPAEAVSVFMAAAATPGNATRCAELEVCLTVVQTASLVVTLVDNWFGARAELGLLPLQLVSYRLDDELVSGGPWTDSPMLGGGTWSLTLPMPLTGLVLLELRVDGEALELSPLVIAVVPPTCTGGAQATVEGTCLCPTDQEPRGIDGACLPIVTVIPVMPIAVGTCIGGAAIILLAIGIAFVVHRRNEALWRIPAGAITYPATVEVLGRGTFGLVVKGSYRGTMVALKRSLPVEPVRSSSRSGGVSLLRFRGGSGGSGGASSASSGASGSQAGGSVGGSGTAAPVVVASARASASGSGTLPSILSRTASVGTRSGQGSGTLLPTHSAQATPGAQASGGGDVRSTLLVASAVTSADRFSLESRGSADRSSLERRGSLDRPRAASSGTRKSQFDMPADDEHDEEKAVAAPSRAGRSSGSGTLALTTNTRSTSQQSSYLPGPCAARFPLLELVLSRLHARRRAAALRRDFVNEMRLLVHLRHPHILTVLGAVLQDSEPILVSELMDRGSLHDLLHNETLPLDGNIVCRLLRDIASGMLFLHSADPPILHNDLKSANVLVDASFRAKVSDFGLSGKRRASRGPPGTPFWMAPELLRRHPGGRRAKGGQPTTATDVYSFGITLSEVFSRAEPYSDSPLTAQEILLRVVGPAQRKQDDPPPLRPIIADSVPPAFADLMRRCWHAEPLVRPCMAAIAAELRLASDAAGDTLEAVTSALVEVKRSRKGERDLLHAVFPAAVAAALAAGRRVEPQHFDCVTVFFSDITGFTDISARLPPIKARRGAASMRRTVAQRVPGFA